MNGEIRVESLACNHCGRQSPITDIQRFPGCKRPVFDCLLCQDCYHNATTPQCDECGNYADDPCDCAIEAVCS